MKLALILLMVLFTAIYCNAQTKDNTNTRAQTAFIEIGGNGLLFSANYESRFANKDNGLGGRIGIGFFGGSGGGLLSVPIGLNYLAGNAPNFFEAGLGYTYVSFTGGDDFFNGHGSIIVPSIGYRYQQKNKGLMARIVISPLVGVDRGGGWIVFGGIGVGYRF